VDTSSSYSPVSSSNDPPSTGKERILYSKERIVYRQVQFRRIGANCKLDPHFLKQWGFNLASHPSVSVYGSVCSVLLFQFVAN
jgi:hypothetical protein